MIDILIYHIHLVLLLYTFTKFWHKDGLKAGFLSLTLALLVFLICWSITATAAYYLYPNEWNSIYFSSDTLALVLILLPEYLYYKHMVFRE